MVPPLEMERREVDEFVKRQVSTADAFLTVMELGGRCVSKGSLEVAEFLKGMRYWERRGCIRLLMETDLQHVKTFGPSALRTGNGYWKRSRGNSKRTTMHLRREGICERTGR